MDFLFQFVDIHTNEYVTNCDDYIGFKWKSINISLVLIVFVCNPTPFLACWVVIAPPWF